ncbi:glycosyltransferase 1 domain-containing protein 1-like isoform X2 [Corticium candelabrum]|uniref:glycosyltransferase 1 domain-containing protein 1-like isoform X2 n=1 Tax=Corticium candelabrum TaxID=121492 RepID=UPI002E272FB4|nr:glycosyltransferase 1 domain-containing protein 1-like isoform X2 [Corticium candelabrum]
MNVVIIAPLLNATGTGNHSTSHRISKQLQELGHSCIVKSVGDFQDSDEFYAWIRLHDVRSALAIHAYRTSGLIKGLDIVPYSVIFGGTDVNEHSKNKDKLAVMTSVVENAEFLIAFTDSLMSQARRLWPDVSRRIIKQPQVGGLRPVKDPLYLVQSVADWHKEDKRIYFIIVGPRLSVDYSNEVETTVSRLSGVCLLPPLAQPDVQSAVRSADIIVNTSRSEGTCQVLLEAMQLRTPVMARAIPGNVDIVTDYKTGLLFTSPEEFVLKAKQLLSSPIMKESLIEEAYDYVCRVHSWKDEGQTYSKVVTNMMCKRTEYSATDQ